MQPAFLLEFIEAARAPGKLELLKFELEKLDAATADQIQADWQKEVKNFSRCLDNYAIRHAFKKHGGAETEVPRGQIPIETVDFLLILPTIQSPDHCRMDINKLGNPIFVYEKNWAAFRLIYVEELRNGRKELMMQTLYKQKIRR